MPVTELTQQLSIQIHDPKEQRQHMHVCLLPDFHLNLKTTSLLGSRAKLQDIPKIEQLLVARLRAAIQDRFVYPHHMTFALPRLISPPMTPESVIPDSQDVRDAAASALSEGMHNLRHDLAERVAALGPTDSASILDSLDNSVNTPDSDTTLPDVADPESEGELEPQPVMPRRVPQSGIISAVATQYTASRPGGSVAASSARRSYAVASTGDPSVAGQFRFRGGQFTSASQPASVNVGTVPLPLERPERRQGTVHSRG